MFARIGAAFYVIWGVLHLVAAGKVYQLANTLETGMVRGRVMQNAWSLVTFAVFAIVIALQMNWKNSKTGYWLNLGVTSAADIGFIAAILIPGYLSLMPGVIGPTFWILAVIFTTIGYFKKANGEFDKIESSG